MAEKEIKTSLVVSELGLLVAEEEMKTAEQFGVQCLGQGESIYRRSDQGMTSSNTPKGPE